MEGNSYSPSSSSSSSSSSRDSCSHPQPSPSTVSCIFQESGDLSTELKLGFSLSAFSLPLKQRDASTKTTKGHLSHWPPIKPLLRSTLEDQFHQSNSKTFFVKVYMEGVPVGRKLDLLAQNGYEGLLKTLRRMFRAKVVYPDICQVPPEKTSLLTYEDKEGDWMMVGDVPWELFLLTVKKLKITRADKC